jgi:hypothetical protein
MILPPLAVGLAYFGVWQFMFPILFMAPPDSFPYWSKQSENRMLIDFLFRLLLSASLAIILRNKSPFLVFGYYLIALVAFSALIIVTLLMLGYDYGLPGPM